MINIYKSYLITIGNLVKKQRAAEGTRKHGEVS